MSLFQAAEHLVHGRAGLAVVGGIPHPRQQLIVYGLPIDPVQLGVPVLVAHGFPDVFEGIDVALAFGGFETGGREPQAGNE